jgi:ATP-dependent RNA helicase DDX51/DBP6
MITCESAQKPLMLFHLVHNHGVVNALVFTKSAESTTRLVRLFEFFEAAWASYSQTSETRSPIAIRSYSSDLGPGERKVILDKFKAQEIQMFVQIHPHFRRIFINVSDWCVRTLYLVESI